MKSIIVCEGGTDLALIQYFMEKANNWIYNDNKKEISYFKDSKNFKKENDRLTIASAGGCSKIPKCFEGVIEKNRYSTLEEEKFDNIIIISDRDEIDTLDDFEKSIKSAFINNDIEIEDINIDNNEWVSITCVNGRQTNINFRVLLLIIPFEETGAIETFLLNAISANDIYDKQIIEKSNLFVDDIDQEGRYIKKRRYKTKAKFDVYFSVRTPLEQFVERRNILKSIPWEEYEEIQTSFKKLNEL